MTESDGTVTILATDANGQITLPSTTNTYTLTASLAETGEDPISLIDAIHILQYGGELRTLTDDQKTAADVNADGEVDILDAIWILQHLGELRTLDKSLIFLDANTGNPLSETTFSATDTPNISVVRKGDVDGDFDPSLITDHTPIITGTTTLVIDENETTVSTLVGMDADGDSLTYSITGGADMDLFTIDASTGALNFIEGPDYETKTSYSVTVSVSDGTNITAQVISIAITDVYEGPTFTSSASFNAPENQTAIGTVTISDAQSDSFTFSITGSELNITNQGVVSFAVAPDYEKRTLYQETITVTNGAGYSSTQTITVSVTNENDNPPTFDNRFYRFTAAENETAINGTISASDPDDIEGSAITYSISGSAINISNDGVLSFASAPNPNENRFFTETVTASDSVKSSTIQIYVSVLAPIVQRGDSINVELGEYRNKNFYTVAKESPVEELVVTHDGLYSYADGTWTNSATALPSGYYAEDTSSDGTYQLITDGTGKYSVLRLINNSWNTVGTLPQTYGPFMDMSDDGTRLARWVYDTSTWGCTIWSYQSGAWNSIGSIRVPRESINKFTCSLSGDGNTLIISAGANSGIGKVYVYTYDGSSWSQKGSTFEVNSGSPSQAGFGSVLDISYNGLTIAFGYDRYNDPNIQCKNDTNGNFASNGRIAVYKYINDGWVMHGDPIIGHEQNCRLGRNFALGETGDTIILSAADNFLKRGYPVYVYKYYNSYWYQLSEKLERVHNNNSGVWGTEPILLGNNDSSFASILKGISAENQTGKSIEVYDLSTGEAPAFTSSATLSAAENQTAIGTVTATDSDSSSVTFSVSGSELSITSAGVLTFVTAPDYETKSSYTATVTATDGTNITKQAITVNITDADDD